MSRGDKKKLGYAAILIGAYFLAVGAGVVPALAIGAQTGIGSFQWDAELTPISETEALLTITTDYTPGSTLDITGKPVQDWVNVRYFQEDGLWGCNSLSSAPCDFGRGVCGWTFRGQAADGFLGLAGGVITAPNAYHYTLNVEEGKPVHVGLWHNAVVDPRTGIPLGGNEPYCSGLTPGEFSGGAYTFDSTWHWTFPEYAFVTTAPSPEPPQNPVSAPVDFGFLTVGGILILGGVVLSRQ